MVKVKVCGITNYQDAMMAVELGVDALGFNFYPRSPRYIEPEEARSIIRKLPPFVVPVGIFANEPTPDELMRRANLARVWCIQLHGDESPEFCRQLSRWPVIKAFRIGPEFDPSLLDAYQVSAFLLDAYQEGELGGTGKAIDWDLALRIKRYGRIILAGGLNSSNVAAAIRKVRPYAVDVCSGVEREPGKKDRALLRAFMEEVERARRDIQR